MVIRLVMAGADPDVLPFNAGGKVLPGLGWQVTRLRTGRLPLCSKPALAGRLVVAAAHNLAACEMDRRLTSLCV
jgi:hypothetical protein